MYLPTRPQRPCSLPPCKRKLLQEDTLATRQTNPASGSVVPETTMIEDTPQVAQAKRTSGASPLIWVSGHEAASRRVSARVCAQPVTIESRIIDLMEPKSSANEVRCFPPDD
jgi:hypothetical protein